MILCIYYGKQEFLEFLFISLNISEAYVELSQTSTMELFAKVANGFSFAKNRKQKYLWLLVFLLLLSGTTEAHLEPSQTSKMVFFCKNNERFSAVNHF